MLPSIGRVKLNRNLFKDTVAQPQVSRRRRVIKVSHTNYASDLSQKVGNSVPEQITLTPELDEVEVPILSELGSESGSNHQHPLPLERETIKRQSDEDLCKGNPSKNGTTDSLPEGESEKQFSTLGENEGMLLSKRDYFKCQASKLSLGSNLDVKVEGPYTRSKYCQVRPNTRSKCASMLNGVNGQKKEFHCSLKLSWCFGSDYAEMQTNMKNISYRSKLRENPSKVHCPIKIEVKSPVSRSGAGVKDDISIGSRSFVQKLSTQRQRSFSTQKNSNNRPSSHRENKATHKKVTLIPDSRVTSNKNLKRRSVNGQSHKIKSARGIAKLEISSETTRKLIAGVEGGTGKCPKGTRCTVPTGFANIDRHSNDSALHLKPNCLVGSQRPNRRAVKISCCTLCGDKYTPPRRKTLVHKSKNISTGPKRPQKKFYTRKTNTIIIKAPKKLIIWIGKYPKVKLCDIAKVCDLSVQEFGFHLTDKFKTQSVRCSKRSSGTRVLKGPSCLETEKHECEKSGQLEKNGSCNRSKCGMNYRRPSSLIEEPIVTEIPTICFPILEGRANETPTNCSPFLSLGKRASRGGCRVGMLDRHVEEDPEAGSAHLATERRGAKRIRLGDNVSYGKLPPIPEIKCNHLLSDVHSSLSRSASGGVEEKTSVMSIDRQYSQDSGVGSSDASDAPVETNHSARQDGGQRKECVNWEASHEPSHNRQSTLMPVEDEVSDSDTEELDLFSCQRVMVYLKRLHLSCARTYMSWPFPKSDQRAECILGPQAELVETSERDSNATPVNKPRDAFAVSTRTSVHLNKVTESSPCTNQQAQSKRDDGIRVEERNLLNEDHEGQCHMIQKGNENVTQFSGKEFNFLPLTPEEQSAHHSPVKTVGAVTRNKQEPTSSVGKDRSETDSHFSIVSPDPLSTPSPLGLSDSDTATTSSPMLFSTTPEANLSPNLFSPFLPFQLHKETVRTITPPTSSSSFSPRQLDEANASTLPNLFNYDEKIDSASIISTASTLSLNSYSSRSSLLHPENKQEKVKKPTKDVKKAADGVLDNWNPPYNQTCTPQTEQQLWLATCAGDTTFVVERGSSTSESVTDTWSEMNMNVNLLEPPLSPITSPQRPSITSHLLQTQSYSEEEDDNPGKSNKCPRQKVLSANCTQPPDTESLIISLFSSEDDYDSEESTKRNNKQEERESTHSSSDTLCDELQHQVLEPKTNPFIATGVPTNARSPPTDSNDDGCDDEGLPNEEEEPSPTKAASLSKGDDAGQVVVSPGDSKANLLDEVAAYEQDILVLEVLQDDPDLFGNLPKESLLNLSPNRGVAASTRTIVEMNTVPFDKGRLSLAANKSAIIAAETSGIQPYPRPVHVKEEEGRDRPWRPQCLNSLKEIDNQVQLDRNNNIVKDNASERTQTIQTLNSLKNAFPRLSPLVWSIGQPIKTDSTDLRWPRNNVYCRLYFSETLCCTFKFCRYLHVAIDEKFCMDTVKRFITSPNPMCLQRAAAVFTAYYQSNPPGGYFSLPLQMSLLTCLLKAGLALDTISVLNASTAHRVLPGREFLLALFEYVREKGLLSLVPELMQLTSKMVDAGLVLSMDYVERMLSSLEAQNTLPKNASIPFSGSHTSPCSSTLEAISLTHTIMEVELCGQHEDWVKMGIVFNSICKSHRSPSEIQRVSGCIAIALLSETKDRLALPFTTFAETVCQEEFDSDLIKSFLGRIGVSLMSRYHKTQQWAKGRRLVEVLSKLKINFSILKGLFGNEDSASRCRLVTIATELFLRSGSVEGALNILRGNEWFVSSCQWPCEVGDIEERTRVLVRLAEKTSHRDSLDVLTNLPGLKEPSDLVDVSIYSDLFQTHLQTCAERNALTVASDTLEFMLSKMLALDPPLLHTLLQKLGKQNLWLRARELFKRALGAGYYCGISAPPMSLALTVPCVLGEIELALSYEMFITVNASAILDITQTPCLSITLKRTLDCESKYLSSGSCLLSAAVIPNPKLTVHYRSVNPSQEQVFTLDTVSARRWLRHNHSWAKEVWTHCSYNSTASSL